MLRATARLLRPGGSTAFYVIEVADGLAPAEREIAVQVGPRAVASRLPYPEMMRRAGFVVVCAEDVTDAYLATSEAWLQHSSARREELAAIDGHEAVEERLAGWRDAIGAIRRGSLRRTLYWGHTPT